MPVDKPNERQQEDILVTMVFQQMANNRFGSLILKGSVIESDGMGEGRSPY